MSKDRHDPNDLATCQIISEALPSTAPGWNAVEISGALQAKGMSLSSEDLWFALTCMVDRGEIEVANPIRVRSAPRRYIRRT